ncbi:hypothetical protein JL721_5909 [Aureococcus anophagefferens]|nr:hypothetical protein JL721_5909 [Aureococcus anophagefferens]
MGASKIAALLARYASAAEDPPADALTVVDGNNLAHHLAARCDTYAALDAATRAWIAARGDVVAFFDGPRPDATAKAGELARRADAKGDAAAARLLEGRARSPPGEAGDAVAAFCADAPRAVVASDDCDFLLRGLPLVRLSDGRLWRRDSVAADARGAAVLEVALLLGVEDVAASVRDVDEAVLVVARGSRTTPPSRVRSGAPRGVAERAAPPPLHRCFDAATFFALCDAPAALNVAAATFSPSAPGVWDRGRDLRAPRRGRRAWRPDADAWGRERLHSDVSADTWAPARDPEHRPDSSDGGSSDGDSSEGGVDDVSRLLAHVAALEALLAAAGVAAPPRPSRFRDDDGGGASDDDDDDDEEELPIDAYREDILQAVDAMPASIVRGETGSGKSTRLPRFLLDSRSAARAAAGVRVGLGGGDVDAMRRRSDAGDDGKGRVRLWYMTSGVCAKLLTYKPRFFDDVTHLCIDEVHERDVDTDVLLALARERLRRARLAPRVVLLSATLDAALLRRYFGADAPLDIPGRRHDLARVCVEDLGTDRDPILAGAWLPPRQLELAVWLARALAAGTDGGFAARAVLIFVAGLSDIGAVADKFEALRGGNVDYVLVPVHGELPFEAQRDALLCEGLEPTGRRVVRILVATNAAESSLTLPDVDAVVDCGSRKLPTYDASCDRVLLRHAWASQATAKQRAGRTGRVSFGVCYHLVSSNLLNRCRVYDAPHVQAAPLDQVVLGLRGSLPHSLAAPLLREFPSPPSEAQIADAFGLLEKRGLLEVRAAPPKHALPTDVIDAYDGTPLTPAGRLAASLPDYLVAARGALLGKRHFDGGDACGPLALVRAVRAFRARGDAAERRALCASAHLHFGRMEALDGYARGLQARAPDRRMDAAVLDPTLARLLLVWAYFDQVAVLEKGREPPCVKEGLAGPAVERRQLQALFPPIGVAWRLSSGDGYASYTGRKRVIQRRFNASYTGSRVAEAEGARVFCRDDQDALLRRFLDKTAAALERARCDWCRTGPGYVEVHLAAGDADDAALRRFFGPAAAFLKLRPRESSHGGGFGRKLRVPKADRGDATAYDEIGLKGDLGKRAAWTLFEPLTKIAAAAALPPHSLEAAFRPRHGPVYCVAATMALHEGAPEKDGKAGLHARLDGVALLPSLPWLALALRAGGLSTALDDYIPPFADYAATRRVLLDAERLGHELRDLVDGGAGFADLERARALGRRLERLFDLGGRRPAPEPPPSSASSGTSTLSTPPATRRCGARGATSSGARGRGAAARRAAAAAVARRRPRPSRDPPPAPPPPPAAPPPARAAADDEDAARMKRWILERGGGRQGRQDAPRRGPLLAWLAAAD